jgi:hypothetical protein
MLNLLDDALAGFLRVIVPLSAREIDVAFEAPDREWAAQLSRPTVNLFLWDVRPSLAEREHGLRVVTGDDGTHRREGPRPRIDCRYLITAWTTDVADEHALLGQVLAALLLNPILPAEYLKPRLVSDDLPRITLRTGGDTDSSDFWSAIGGQLKPGLDVHISLTVEAAAVQPAGPPVESVDSRVAEFARDLADLRPPGPLGP